MEVGALIALFNSLQYMTTPIHLGALALVLGSGLYIYRLKKQSIKQKHQDKIKDNEDDIENNVKKLEELEELIDKIKENKEEL